MRLALYKIINGNWQNYEQGIMPHPQIFTNMLFFGREKKQSQITKRYFF